jgi:hypothetical protein
MERKESKDLRDITDTSTLLSEVLMGPPSTRSPLFQRKISPRREIRNPTLILKETGGRFTFRRALFKDQLPLHGTGLRRTTPSRRPRTKSSPFGATRRVKGPTNSSISSSKGTTSNSIDTVGGRLSRRFTIWQQVCHDRRILELVQHGLTVKPFTKIPLARFPCQTPVPSSLEARLPGAGDCKPFTEAGNRRSRSTFIGLLVKDLLSSKATVKSLKELS